MRRRLRVRLLVLLWLWAGCMFLVVDLFWNVDEFDGIRPRADLYRATRYVAHRMVGEPWLEGGLVGPPRVRPVSPGDELALGERLRVAAQSPDAALLREIARRDVDSRVRAGALRRLVRIEGPRARPLLHAVLTDAAELDKVRAEATRLLGLTGDDVLPELEELIDTDQPACVREGAVAGLACVGLPHALVRVVRLAAEPALTDAAASAVRASWSPAHKPVLTGVATEAALPVELRVAACAALARSRKAPPELCALIVDESAPDEVRAAAARALGSIGDDTALPALVESGSPACVRAVRQARARLEARRKS